LIQEGRRFVIQNDASVYRELGKIVGCKPSSELSIGYERWPLRDQDPFEKNFDRLPSVPHCDDQFSEAAGSQKAVGPELVCNTLVEIRVS